MKRLSMVLTALVIVALSASIIQAGPAFQDEEPDSTSIYLPALASEQRQPNYPPMQYTSTPEVVTTPAPITTTGPTEELLPDEIEETSSEVSSDGGSTTVAAAPASFSPGYLYGFNRRVRWNSIQSYQTLIWYNSNITSRSHVFVSAAEVVPGTFTKFLGSAPVRTEAIAPFNGGVRVRVYVGWDRPLPIALDFLVVNP